MASIILTVADHDQNGFVALAEFTGFNLLQAAEMIAAVDATISDEAEPDIRTAPFTFILDLMEGYDQIDSGARCLPMQIAMSLAPEQVSRWLEKRPYPDDVRGAPPRVAWKFSANEPATSGAQP